MMKQEVKAAAVEARTADACIGSEVSMWSRLVRDSKRLVPANGREK